MVPTWYPYGTQSLILAEIAYLRGTFGTFYPHKIVLNNSIPMVVMALYMVQPLLRYKPIFGMHPMHPPCTPMHPPFSRPFSHSVLIHSQRGYGRLEEGLKAFWLRKVSLDMAQWLVSYSQIENMHPHAPSCTLMHPNVDVELHPGLWVIAPGINWIGKGIERPP